MPNQVLSESKHILKRVLIGAITSVSGAAIIYFLFVKEKPHVTELELKNNTIEAWKEYVNLENDMQRELDTLTARRTRDKSLEKYLKADSALRDYTRIQKPVPAEIRKNFNRIYFQLDSMYKAYLREDTLVNKKFRTGLEKLQKTTAIDPELAILFSTRQTYQQEMTKVYLTFKKNLSELVLDTTTEFYQKFDRATENSETYTNANDNIRERTGRSIEDLAASLTKKYKTPFPLSDFKFYAAYMLLKNEKNKRPKPEVAPPSPDKKEPGLPD